MVLDAGCKGLVVGRLQCRPLSMRMGQGLPCGGHSRFQPVSSGFTMDPLRDIAGPISKVSGAFVEMYLRKSWKHCRKRKLEKNKSGTPKSEEQEVHSSHSPVYKDLCKGNFLYRGNGTWLIPCKSTYT